MKLLTTLLLSISLIGCSVHSPDPIESTKPRTVKILEVNTSYREYIVKYIDLNTGFTERYRITNNLCSSSTFNYSHFRKSIGKSYKVKDVKYKSGRTSLLLSEVLC